jgi:glyoxylase-like metal-dependent hydrolase (beta-lactamase superfamily II)
VHRTEWEDRKKKLAYEWEYQHEAWSASQQPTLYDLAAKDYGPFDRSHRLTDGGDVVVLSLPGHTRGHVGIAVRTPDLSGPGRGH